MIDERVGVGLLLQLADLVIAPFAGTTTERAALCRKPTIICQAMGQAGFQGEYLYWEPRPEKIPALSSRGKSTDGSRATVWPDIAELVTRSARPAAPPLRRLHGDIIRQEGFLLYRVAAP